MTKERERYSIATYGNKHFEIQDLEVGRSIGIFWTEAEAHEFATLKRRLADAEAELIQMIARAEGQRLAAERLAELGQQLLDEAVDYGRGWTVEEFLENEPLVKQFREALAAWAFVDRK